MDSPGGSPAGEWQTARLVLRPPAPNDLHALAALHADARVMQYVDAPFSFEHSRAWLERAITAHAKHPGLGEWVADLPGGAPCIGVVSLRRCADGPHAGFAPQLPAAFAHPPDRLLEIGWRFHIQHWGRGYATETGRALVRRAFERHAAAAVCAFALVENGASLAAITRCGLRRAAQLSAGGRAVAAFALDRGSWAAER